MESNLYGLKTIWLNSVFNSDQEDIKIISKI